ncbi:transient receptor potential cation channel subfamily M member 2-like [Saccostrea cucullata]|uniref:transient receptor potential cation channel subfamily M member 2-like n=1 Tax=Saccostrea cuccullata TaxID=36930 RepID=UPI002ED27944
MEYDAQVFRFDVSTLKDANEISNTDEMPHDLYELDTIVCCTVIAVCMTERAPMDFKEKYANPICMYLLKSGKWKIPKDCIKHFFSHRSIEYIFEKNMTEDFKNGLWEDLKEATNDVYEPPVWNGKELETSISGLFGLIFLALLKEKFYAGAKQFIETGCVRIHFILVGCVILQEAVDDWRTSEADKEKFELMIKKYTHQALRIISCVHEEDKQRNAKTQQQENKSKEITKEEQKNWGENIQHSGRLLLNHGYLTGGIQTENRTFLDNEVVKNILNEMWYGVEKVTKYKVLCFVLLAILHVILLPLLMITLENKPLEWLYRQYKIPFMKVFLNVMSLFALLTGYAYMLLFDFDKGISNSDIFVIAWMTSFFIEETKQVFVAAIRRKKKQYITDPWNILDWLSLTTYTCGMLMKLNDMYDYFTASKVLLVAAFIMLSIRILHMFSMSELLGPTLVIIQKMFKDTIAFMAIMFIISMCYNISYYAILYSENSEFTFEELEKITRNGYWMLFGELNLEGDRLTEPDCTFNETEYRDGSQERCPSSLGRFLAPYLKAVYVLTAVILLLNLLIAMYSNTFAKVQEKSKFYWSQLQTDFLEEFSLKSIFPVHMQLLAIPFFVIHAVVWMVTSIRRCCNSSVHAKDEKSNIQHAQYTHEDDIKKMKRIPMFVQGFIYDSNYDLKLKETREAEGQAALITKGEMDINEENKFKEMNRNLMRHRRKIEKSMIENFQKMESNLLTKLRTDSNRRSKSELSPHPSFMRYRRQSSIKSRISSHISDLESDSDT